MRERPTFLLKSLVHTTLSLSLSLVKTTLHNAIKRTRIHRFYFEFLFFKENIGIYPLRETTFCFSLSLHTFRVLLFPCFVWRKNRGRDIMKSFRFKRKAFFVFVFFSTCVCVFVCLFFTSVAVSTGFTSKNETWLRKMLVKQNLKKKVCPIKEWRKKFCLLFFSQIINRYLMVKKREKQILGGGENYKRHVWKHIRAGGGGESCVRAGTQTSWGGGL